MSGDSDFSIQEKVFLASHAICSGSTQAMRIFEDKYKKMAPPRTTVNYWKDMLWKTGSLMTQPRSGRPSLDHDKTTDVVNYVKNNPTTSQRHVAQMFDVAQSSVSKILVGAGMKCYKFSWVQALNDDDPDRRLEFCNWILGQNSSFVNSIVFSDESSFYLNGLVNKHNAHYYSTENEHRLMEIPIKSPAYTVWAAISYHHGVVYSISDETMNKERYLNILQTKVGPFMQLRHNKYFQQDGAPPHYANICRNWLNLNLSGRWIGRRGSVEWPPRSPDLTIPDFWLWGHMKECIYSKNPQTMDQLKREIENYFANLNIQFLKSCYCSFLHRCQVCADNDGGHFQHLL